MNALSFALRIKADYRKSMVEPGGPSTQAGIEFQNAVAALYLGDLLRLDDNGRDRVIEVRVEAPSAVDDLVVCYADHRRRWMQVKLNLKSSGHAWRKLWLDFLAQIQSYDASGADSLCLVLGEDSAVAQELRETAQRTSDSSEAEWRERLTLSQKALLHAIEGFLGASAFPIFRKLDVEVLRASSIGKDFAGARMPQASISPNSLYSHLQTAASAGGKRREIFRAPKLREMLRQTHGIEFGAPPRWGLAAYLTSVGNASISVPGTNVGGPAASAFVWPKTALTDEVHSDFDDEQRLGNLDLRRRDFDLRYFPTPQHATCIVHAGPGFGKSALLIALATRIASEGVRIPAIVPLGALADDDLEVVNYLQSRLNTEHSISIDWIRLCETGVAVLLLDGLDEVSLEKRTAVVQRIEQFARRFPETSWILTVRDPAIVPVGFNAQKVELLPLTFEEMPALMRAVQPTIEDGAISALTRQIEAHPDLERLVRIPLFLSLLVATWRPGIPLPTQRSDLIEAYLKTLFRPEEHKRTHRCADPERLQTALQSLAFQLLELGEIGAPERNVRRVLGEHSSPSASGEQLFDDALRCGILRRPTSARLAFPFPIVQEYLAAQALLEKHPQQIAALAERAVERPWAQAIQFVLEKLPDASQIAQDLLAKEDDAFVTGARLLARCILNGMRCSPDVRDAVGDRLAASWHRQSFWTAKRIGRMLLDGWTDPLRPELRKALHRYHLSYHGGEEILAHINSPELTLSVLRSYLKRPAYVANLGVLQPAVTVLSAAVFPLYIDAAGRNEGERVWAIANLIARLDGRKIASEALDAVVNDEGRPTGIRLATWGLTGTTPDDRYWSLASQALRSETQSDHWAALKALAGVSNAELSLAIILRNAELPTEAHFSALDHLKDALPDPSRRLKFLRKQAQANDLSEELRFRSRVMAAYQGDRLSFDKLLHQLDGLAPHQVGRVIRGLNEWGHVADGELITKHLTRRTLSPAEKVQLATELMISSTHKLLDHSYDAGGLESSLPHPSYEDFVALLSEWRDTETFELTDRISIDVIAARARVPGAAADLRRLITKVAVDEDYAKFENPLNGQIRSAMDELSRLAMPLDLTTTICVAENSESNALMGAIYHFGAIGTRPALDYLLERYRRERGERSIIFDSIEQISTRLGLKIIEDADGLSVS